MLSNVNAEEDKAKIEDSIHLIGNYLSEQVQTLKSNIEKQEEAFQKRKTLSKLLSKNHGEYIHPQTIIFEAPITLNTTESDDIDIESKMKIALLTSSYII